jgi:uncharacterized DUF497 family protein
MGSNGIQRRRLATIVKHQVWFAEAQAIFKDDDVLTIFDDSIDEERYIAIGVGSLERILSVVYTVRGGSVRRYENRK